MVQGPHDNLLPHNNEPLQHLAYGWVVIAVGLRPQRGRQHRRPRWVDSEALYVASTFLACLDLLLQQLGE